MSETHDEVLEIEKAPKRRSIATVLALPVVVVVAVSVTVTGWIAFYNGSQAVNDLATQLHRQASITTCDNLDSYMFMPRLANQIVADEFQSGKLNLRDQKAIESRLKALSLRFPYTIGYLYLGPNGTIAGYGRQDNSKRPDAEPKGQNLADFDPLLDKTYPSGPVIKFPTDRMLSELNKAIDLKQNKSYWSTTCIWPGSELGIAAIVPIRENNRIVGILSTTVSPRRIGRYLSAYPVTEHSQVFIIERDGTLVATSEPGIAEERVNGIAKRVSAFECRGALIRGSAKLLSKLPQGLNGLQEPYEYMIDIGGSTYFCRTKNYRDIHGLDWLVVSAIPESDFMANIHSNTRQTILVVVVSIILGTLMATLIARRITHPISLLNVSTKAIAHGDWARPLPSTRLSEVGELSDSFKRMAEQLQGAIASIQSSEKRYRNMFENSPVSLWQMDLSEVKVYIEKLVESGVNDLQLHFKESPEHLDECASLVKIVDVNVATLQLLHATDMSVLLANLSQVHSDTSYRNYQQEFFASLNQSTLVQSDTILTTLDNDPLYVNICTTILPGNEESWSKVLVSVVDITARQQSHEQTNKLNAILEDRVRERTAQLMTANHELEAFAYSVSHDLRAPLRSIEGYSRIFQLDYASVLDEEALEYMERIRTTSQRMSDLIDALLSLSRIARKEMNLAPQNLSEAAREVAAELHAINPDRKVEFAIQDGITVRADTALMRIVLDNLLSNAWKFTGLSQQARIEIGTLSQNGKQVCFIRDNGVGFDSTYAEKMFDAFQRLHTEEFEGTGIGLAIVQRIIHRHGGEVWAEGEVGAGATFYFSLPSSSSV